MDRKLGMELAGFDPLDTFSQEQVYLMRSMKSRGNGVRTHTKSKIGTALESSDINIIRYRKEAYKE